jgi:DNA-binding NarL/FixJ family response regulator
MPSDAESSRSPAPARRSSDVLTVAIVEDQRNLREGLQTLIGGTVGYCCTGAFRSMEETLACLPPGSEPPHVILVDIGLPGISGIEGIPILKERFPRSSLLVLSVYDDDARIFAALCAGASGYLLKKTPPARLLEGIQEVAAGGSPMSLEVARKVIELFRQFHPPDRAECDLTPHEIRLLKLLAEGYNYKTAAAKLSLSVNTVSSQIHRIYEKLHVHSKSEAVAKALRSFVFR